ncbi:hypothetical protein ACA910_012936 [Epithemia clementina (nom. ined.)]
MTTTTLATCSGQGSSGGQHSQQRLADAFGFSATIGRTASAPSSENGAQQLLVAAAIQAEQNKMLRLAALQQQQQHMIYAGRSQFSGVKVEDSVLSETQILNSQVTSVSQATASLIKQPQVHLGTHSLAEQGVHSKLAAESQNIPLEICSRAKVETPIKSSEKKGLHEVPPKEHPRTTDAAPGSPPLQVEWTPELDVALRQLDEEHCGDWKKIGLRMNLSASLCRQRLAMLLRLDEASMTEEERKASLLARERRLRRESEILSKSERSKFFRTMRQHKKRKAGEAYTGEDTEFSLRTNAKLLSNISHNDDKEGSHDNSAESDGDGGYYEAEEPSKKRIKWECDSNLKDGEKVFVDITDSENTDSDYQHKLTGSSDQDNEFSPCIPRSSEEAAARSNNSADSVEEGGDEDNTGANSVSSPSSSKFARDDEIEEYKEARGLAKSQSPRLGGGESGTQYDASSEAAQQYRKGFFFRVTKMHPGKRKESLGFIALPKDTTFAKARAQMTYELDLDDSWVFFLSSLGPVSRRQESSLGMMVSWLTVKHKEMPGSRRNPIDIIIVNRR